MMGPEEHSDKDAENFYCSITQELMSDPVVAADGHSYERAAIQAWISQRGGRALSPMTGEKLAHLELTPNITLRTIIRDYQTTLPQRHRRTLTEADLLLAIKLREEELSGILAKQGQQLSAVAQAKAEAEEKLGPLGQGNGRLTQQNQRLDQQIQQLQSDNERLRRHTVSGGEKNTLSDKILTEHLADIQRVSQQIETVTTSHAANTIKRALSTAISHKKLRQTGLIRQEEDTSHQLEILQQEAQQTQAALQKQLDEGIQTLDTQLKLKLADIAKEIAKHAGEEGDDDTVEELINQRRQVRETHANDQAILHTQHTQHKAARQAATETQRLKAGAQKVRLQQIKASKASKQRELSRWAGYTTHFTDVIETERGQLAELTSQRAAISKQLTKHTEQAEAKAAHLLIARREREERHVAAREAAARETAREAERQAAAAREAERMAMSPDVRVQAKADSVKEKTAPAAVTELLNATVRGKLDDVKRYLQNNPALVFAQGDVTDSAGRTFKKITAFQYAVWVLDKQMWELILTVLPLTDAYDQLHALEHERQDIIHAHGAHLSFDPLLNAYQKYLGNWRAWYNACNWDALKNGWCKEVGGAQKLMPAWFVYLFSDEGSDKAWPTKQVEKAFARSGDGTWPDHVGKPSAFLRGQGYTKSKKPPYHPLQYPLITRGQAIIDDHEGLAKLKSARVRELAELTDQLSQAANKEPNPTPLRLGK